jgi:hypothetical protein
MPPASTPLKGVATLLKRLRWLLMLAILSVAVGLAWYGWQSRGGLVWFVLGGLLLLSVVVMILGSKIAFWLARRLEHQILRRQSEASRRLVNAGLQQGERFAQLSSQRWEKNIQGAKQVLGQARGSLAQDRWWGSPGKVTWISVPRGPDAACPSCHHEVRSGAKFCDQCGKPIGRY